MRRALAALAALIVTSLAGLSVGAASAAPPPHAKGKRTTTETTAPTTTTSSTTTSSTSTTSTSVPSTPTGTSTPDAPVDMRRAALRITIQTSSEWAQVELPGISAGHLVVTNSGGSQIQPTAGGMVVRGAGGAYRAVTVDVVTEIPVTLDAAWMTLRQGEVGVTFAGVQNRTVQIYNVATLSTQAGGTSTTSFTADHMMGDTQLKWTRATDERKVLAFTYPWFDESATTDPQLGVHPIDPWIPSSADDALQAARTAREHGIDGFVMAFSGGARHGLPLHQHLVAAEQTGGTATILLEAVEAGSAAVAEQWLTEALHQSDSPAWLRHNGVPVVFIFGGYTIPAAEWQAITDRLAAAGTPVRIISDMWTGKGDSIVGGYRYNALLQAPEDPMTASELTDWNRSMSRNLRARATLGSGTSGLVVATVQPGWDDRRLRGEDRLTVAWDGVATYDSTWEAALAAEPDWVAITSWNEWYESTGIAPSQEHGFAGLEATDGWSQVFHG